MDALIDRAELLRRAGGLLLGGALGGAAAGGGPRPARPAGRARLGDLARATRGALVTRSGGAAYAAAREVVNSRYAGARPLAVLRAAGADDVRAAVRWAARGGVPVTARAGGHSYAGYSTRDDGLVIDLGAMNGIRIAPDGRTVQVGAGALLIDVHTALARRGLTVPAGSCPTVGIAGLALGGGVGFASRAFGTTSDNVEALTVVTADGRAVACDARRNADLLWACRGGGGGNFGVATGFTLRTHPVGPASHFFASFGWADAPAVIARWQRWAPEAPDELFSILSLSAGGPAPRITVLGQHLGGEAALRRLLRGLTVAAAPLSLSTGTSGYLDLQRRWAGCLDRSDASCRRPPRTPFAAKSDYVDAPLGARGIRTLTRWIERRQSQASLGSGAILLDSYGGAINRVAPDATAFVHRDALFSCQYLAYWGAAAAAPAALAWIRGFHRAMRPHVSGRAYQNYIDPDLAGWRRAYYGANYDRLADVKAARDPDRLFRFRQAIGA